MVINFSHTASLPSRHSTVTTSECSLRGPLCADLACQWQSKGFVLDTTIVAPAVRSHLRQASTTACAAGLQIAADARKPNHHRGRLNEQRWWFGPMSTKCFSRFGVHNSEFLHVLSWHAAHVRGGTTGVPADLKRRCEYILVDSEAQLRAELSVANLCVSKRQCRTFSELHARGCAA